MSALAQEGEAPPQVVVDYSSVVEAVLVLGSGVVAVSAFIRALRWVMSLL